MQICKTNKKATRLYPKFDIIIVNTCVITIEHLTKTLHGEIIKRKRKKIFEQNIWSFTSYLPLKS